MDEFALSTLVIGYFTGCAITWLLMNRNKLTRKQEDLLYNRKAAVQTGVTKG